ncbi:MAG TPA: translation initiation factor IF-3 [Erysipelotrichaceae bacterium]|nr:translation initiation factor IF-3 [Erysipelotrichia bacterium]HPX32556.1 translation initiation factor IF-3 [Erysipelotrichaceae bacterium]HQA84597.1 translation initiation factor IF-3 [Erysipelotrichaceae bacterium]
MPGDLVNESIRFREVLVIAPDGESLGVMTRNQALDTAYDYELDLVCVAEKAKPPVCRIMDYGKYRFEQQKKAKEAKRNQHVTEVKGVRLSPVIDINDFNTKVRQAKGWLEDGNRVKVDMRFRGRMMTRQDVGKKVMENFITELSEVATVDRQPKLEGNTMSCTLTPIKK